MTGVFAGVVRAKDGHSLVVLSLVLGDDFLESIKHFRLVLMKESVAPTTAVIFKDGEKTSAAS